MFNSALKRLACGNVPLIQLTFRRTYSRTLWRKPVRIISNAPEEDIEPLRQEGFSKQLQISNKLEEHISTEVQAEEKELMIPPYVKLQKNDAKFSKLLTIVKNRKLREKKGKILLEGKRLINDAILAGMQLQAVYFSREKDLADIKFRDVEKVDICKVFYRTLRVWSDLTTPPGVMALFKRPSTDDLHVLSEPVLPVTVICDNIREPGNLGSIIRNCAAAGCEHILLLKGCVDPWECKVLRAGCGGHFRIPIINDVEWTHINNYLVKDSTIFIAENSADILETTSEPDFVTYDEDIEINEETKYVTYNENNQPVKIDETFKEETALETFQDIDLPCHLYSSIKFPQKNIVLYIGGETHGVDPRAIKLACDYGGRKIKIPLENNTESLNSAFAMTVILFEIKRQLKEVYVTR